MPAVAKSAPLPSRPASRLLALNGAITRLEKLLITASCVALIAIMFILVLDVGGRYALNRPIQWAYDLIQLFLLPALVSLALSDVFRRDGNVSIELLYGTLEVQTKRAFRLFAAILIAISISPIVWLSAEQAVSRFRGGIVSVGVVPWPTWVPYLFLCLGFLVLVLRLICDGAALATSLVRRSIDVPGESPGRQGTTTKAEAVL